MNTHRCLKPFHGKRIGAYFAFGIALTLLIRLSLLDARCAEANYATSAGLQKLVDNSVTTALQTFATNKLSADQLAITVLDLKNPALPEYAGHRGKVQIYPASVVKLFYLVAAHRWMEDKKIEDTPELRRAMKDMIVESYNEATHYVVDILTGTTSGPELPQLELDQWFEKRNAVNRYFQSLGYTDINANRKPWCEGPYGRESQSIKTHDRKRNMLTTDSTARLVLEIATGKVVSQTRCDQMLQLMDRNSPNQRKDPEGQVVGFIGAALPKGAKSWSKAGWTSDTRHDAALVEFADGRRIVLVIFSVNQATNGRLLPFIATKLFEGIGETSSGGK